MLIPTGRSSWTVQYDLTTFFRISRVREAMYPSNKPAQPVRLPFILLRF